MQLPLYSKKSTPTNQFIVANMLNMAILLANSEFTCGTLAAFLSPQKYMKQLQLETVFGALVFGHSNQWKDEHTEVKLQPLT